MLDLVYLKLGAGNGGDGKVSFLRSRGITKGGPNGGNGGDGGSIKLRATSRKNTLQHFSGLKEFKAQNGEKGKKFHQEGAKGADLVLEVPLGTVIWLAEENEASERRRLKTGLKRGLKKAEVGFKKYYVETATSNPEKREEDRVERDERRFADYLDGGEIENPEGLYEELPENKLLKLFEFKEDGDEFLVCQGGFGGKGNDSFKGPTHQTPLEAEYGTWGEQKVVFLEVKALADVGLVGFPNAGKSTLLSRMTKAQPKVANYPFTTLEPHLGVINYGREQSIVMADIPGLIEGASEGKGLGFEFLRHLENCRTLLYVLSLDEEIIFNEEMSNKDKAKVLEAELQALETELKQYKKVLFQKKRMILINKIDLYDEEMLEEIKKQIQTKMSGEEVMLISGYTGVGLEELKKKLRELV